MVKCVLITITFIIFCVSSEDPCPKALTVDITKGVRNDTSIIKDGFRFQQKDYFVKNSTIYGCICNIKPCIRKCCGANEIMVNRTCVLSDHKLIYPVYEGKIVSSSDANHYIIHNKYCKKHRILLQPHDVTTHQFYVQANGSLFLPEMKKKIRNPEEYCLEVFDVRRLGLENVVSALVCLVDEDTGPVESSKLLSLGKLLPLHRARWCKF